MPGTLPTTTKRNDAPAARGPVVVSGGEVVGHAVAVGVRVDRQAGQVEVVARQVDERERERVGAVAGVGQDVREDGLRARGGEDRAVRGEREARDLLHDRGHQVRRHRARAWTRRRGTRPWPGSRSTCPPAAGRGPGRRRRRGSWRRRECPRRTKEQCRTARVARAVGCDDVMSATPDLRSTDGARSARGNDGGDGLERSDAHARDDRACSARSQRADGPAQRAVLGRGHLAHLGPAVRELHPARERHRRERLAIEAGGEASSGRAVFGRYSRPAGTGSVAWRSRTAEPP